MNKVYNRINWQNYPSTNTAVNENNLNKMDSALNEIDTRVVEHETTKANVASLNELIKSWTIDETTGVITIIKVSGEHIIFDLNIEKVPVGFSMSDDGILTMTTEDGTEFTANIGNMIPILTFQDTEEIVASVTGEGVNKTYSFSIKTGSIAEDKLQPNFLADCRLYSGNAENSANLANQYAQQAKESAESISNNASDIYFDDSVAETGSKNVQGAIEGVKSVVDTNTKDIDTHNTVIRNLARYIGHSSSTLKVETITLTHGVSLVKDIYTATNKTLVQLQGFVAFPPGGTDGRAAVANVMIDNVYINGSTFSGVQYTNTNAPLYGTYLLEAGQTLRLQFLQQSGIDKDIEIHWAHSAMDISGL